MKATEKMRAFGLKELEARTGRSLSILYRWIKAIENGRGVRDENKRLLIEATAGSDDPISWGDFEPAELRDAA
ncbi:MAG: hypothetical protein ACK4FB_08905 [Brevundimonas sp.]|uniref:hypothetical protein n=1 Tax=Brevundimonas sp. TaxID=1871086 RepID=UPI00391D64A0